MGLDSALPVWSLLLVLFKWLFLSRYDFSGCWEPKVTENPSVHLCDCSGNSPCSFLSPLLLSLFMKRGAVSSHGAQSLCDCTSDRANLVGTELLQSQGYLASQKHCSSCAPSTPTKKKIRKGLRSNINDSFHFRLMKWVCVSCKLNFDFDGQLLYELELFVKNIQWFILIWRKKQQHLTSHSG